MRDIRDRHLFFSFIKSGFRFAGYFALITQTLWAAGILLLLAEVFGVIEEL